MALIKKINSADPAIKIRIIKALGEVKPFGMLKHFKMIRILRNMKKPNVLNNQHIWTFMNENFKEEEYYQEKDEKISFDEFLNG